MEPKEMKRELQRIIARALEQNLDHQLHAKVSVVSLGNLQLELPAKPGRGPDFYEIRIVHPTT